MGRKPSPHQTPEQAACAAYMREYYRRPGKAAKAREMARRYAASEQGKKTLRAYRQTPEARKTQVRAHRNWRHASEENMAKHRAHSAAWKKANPGKARNLVHRRRARLSAAYVEEVSPFRLWLKATGRCALCGEPVNLADVSVDHIVPLSRGGEHSHANTQATHLVCNVRKGAR